MLLVFSFVTINSISHAQLHRGCRGEGAENPGEILYPAAGDVRIVLRHVAPDARPEVPRLGLGCRAGAGAAQSLGERLQRLEERIPGGAGQGRRTAEFLPGRDAEGEIDWTVELLLRVLNALFVAPF